ncbi:MAG: NAD(P)-binding domain-containing protein [Steroidobacteraceae bacterium]
MVIGAGHTGLATSRVLSEHSIDHVVLERGEVANSWRRERWESLRLLTPNWQSRLPGYPYRGSDPDGFMTMPEVIERICGFAAAISAPVRTRTTVRSVRRIDGGYRVATDRGEIRSRSVVLASGAANTPHVPEVRRAVPEGIPCITTFDYFNPERLPQGGVLIVGASATGVQLADEIQRSGRPVTLSVGEHVRLPRTYRGRARGRRCRHNAGSRRPKSPSTTARRAHDRCAAVARAPRPRASQVARSGGSPQRAARRLPRPPRSIPRGRAVGQGFDNRKL